MNTPEGITEQLRAIAATPEVALAGWPADQIASFAAAVEARHLEAVTRPVGDVVTWMSEAMMTIVVTAAAKAAYEDQAKQHAAAAPDEAPLPPWEVLPPMSKYQMRTLVATGVFAAFAAVPDLRRQAWLDGFATGVDEGYDPDPAESLCPYPDVEL